MNIFCYVNKENEMRPVFSSKNNETPIYHANLLMISNEKGTIWHYTAIKAYLDYYMALHLNIMVIIIVLIALDFTEQLKNLVNMKINLITMVFV